MAPNRRLPILLGVLAVALAALVVSRGGLGSLTTFSSPFAPQATSGAAEPATSDTDPGPAAPREPAYPDVNLEGLTADRVEPATGGRNPFSLRAEPRPGPSDRARMPPPPGAPGASDAQAAAPPSRPAGVPSIPLKFIGIVSLPGDRGKLAVLSDGDFVYHGRQGDVVEGRYRVVSIGDETVELEHTDGRGRQSLALTGS